MTRTLHVQYVQLFTCVDKNINNELWVFPVFCNRDIEPLVLSEQLVLNSFLFLSFFFFVKRNCVIDYLHLIHHFYVASLLFDSHGNTTLHCSIVLLPAIELSSVKLFIDSLCDLQWDSLRMICHCSGERFQFATLPYQGKKSASWGRC